MSPISRSPAPSRGVLSSRFGCRWAPRADGCLQLMLLESALLATLACGAGALFAWWAAPFIVSMLAPAERPVRLILDLDLRAVALGVSLIVAVTMIFGLAHALRASATTPAGALKEIRGPRGHRRLTGTLVAVQMALCVFLLMGASLFVGSLDRLQSRPLGFTPEQLLHVSVDSRRQLPPEEWEQLAAALTNLPRIESATVAGWAPLSGNRWRSSVTAPGVASPEDAPNWVSVSPGYFATMRIAMLQGREFRPGDRSPRLDESKKPVAGVAIVNEAFARVYFGGANPVGRRVVVDSSQAPMESSVSRETPSTSASAKTPIRRCTCRSKRAREPRCCCEPLAAAPIWRRRSGASSRAWLPTSSFVRR